MSNLIVENRFVSLSHYCHHILMKELSLFFFFFSLTCINFLKTKLILILGKFFFFFLINNSWKVLGS
jgi:hypothetical protein